MIKHKPQMAQVMDVNSIATLLRAAGIDCKVNPAPDDSVDDEVEVTDEVSVQVGETYLEVSRFDKAEGVFYHYGSRRTDDELIADVRKALADAQKA